MNFLKKLFGFRSGGAAATSCCGGHPAETKRCECGDEACACGAGGAAEATSCCDTHAEADAKPAAAGTKPQAQTAASHGCCE